jgi:hypothetical protein
MGKAVAGLWLTVLMLSSTMAYPQNVTHNSSPAPNRDINAVLAAHDKELLAIPDVVGVYVGTLTDGRTPCLKVMLARKNPESERKLPRIIEGYRVFTEVTGSVRAFGKP